MFHPLFDLTGRVALVSGAAGNMGRASAIALAEIGADLMIVTDKNEKGLLDTAETIRKLGRKVVPALYDVWDEAQIRAMYQQIDQEFGQIDIVVNIPGANILGHPEEITVEHFMKVIQATLVSKFISCQEAGRRMLARGKGSIINMSSIGGVRALGRGNFAYSVGQAGVIQMTRELSTEWADRGVRGSCAASQWAAWACPMTSRGS
jgi:gluconate 5-dehydrogenase